MTIEKYSSPDKPQFSHGSEIIQNLRGAKGERVGLVKWIRKRKKIKRVVIFGEPGASKTTIINQLAAGLGFFSEFTSYDDILEKTEQKLGPRANWTDKQWKIFDESLYAAMSYIPSQTDGQRHMHFIETMSMTLGRGQDALKKIAAEVALQPIEETDTLLLGAVPNYTTQLDTIAMRTRILSRVLPVTDAQVRQLLENSFGMHILGEESDISLGAKLKKQVGRMAPPQHLAKIHREVIALFTPLVLSMNVREVQAIPLPPEFNDFSQRADQHGTIRRGYKNLDVIVYRQKIIGMEHMLRQLLGINPNDEIPKERAILVYSPHTEGPIYLHAKYL